MDIGVMVGFRGGERLLDEKFANIVKMGFHSCQLNCWQLPQPEQEEADAEYVRSMCEKYRVKVSSFWCGWPGPCFWNFTEGPATLGLVPPAYRYERLKYLSRGIDFTDKIGVRQIVTHAGFIPEDMNDERYIGVRAALKSLIGQLKARNVRFLFETGQETPTTLLRLIEDLGPDYFGINFDAGNLILYGKANPADAIEVVGKYVYDMHAKDGFYPTCGTKLGREVALGEGKANFPHIIKVLKSLGYQGPITIEREIHGEQQAVDILRAKETLERLISED